MYVENAYKEYFVWTAVNRTIQEETNKHKVQWCAWRVVTRSSELILRYYIPVNMIPFRHCYIHTIADFKECYFWKIDQ